MKQAIISQIKASNGIVLGAHTNPDGDAIGALVGMATLCGFFHIPYEVLIEKIPDRMTHLFEGIHYGQEVSIDYDTFICVDCGDQQRLGSYEAVFDQAVHTINIDHHTTNAYFAELNEVKVVAATCELVYGLIQEALCPITPQLASALYTGILTDTGGFMHSCTTCETHQIVAELMKVPFDFTGIYYTQMYAQTETAVKIESIAIGHMEKIINEPYYLSYVTEEDMMRVGAQKEDLGSIVNKIKNIDGCVVAIFIYPVDKDAYKVSLRSNAPIDVAELAGRFGGGGHVRAAGATLKGSLEQVKDAIISALCHKA